MKVRNTGTYYQCDFEQGNKRTKGWIVKEAAKVGNLVELVSEDGLWKVVKVHGMALESKWLQKKQILDRNSLKSIKRGYV